MKHTEMDDEIEDNEANLEETSCLPLLEMASPGLYRLKLTGLPVDASQQVVSRHTEKLKMMEKLGVVDQQTSGPLGLVPPPDLHLIREAIQRLRDPERRLWRNSSGFGQLSPNYLTRTFL